MRKVEHHIQDALEAYTVAFAQQLLEERGLATTNDSAEKWATYRTYCDERELTDASFEVGETAVYLSNVKAHLPNYIASLAALRPGETMDIVDVEKAYRNINRKGDFLIVFSGGDEIAVSLKNYRKRDARPQVFAGTFQSLILNLLFDPAGVGSFINPVTNKKFQGKNQKARNEALTSIGRDDLIAEFEALERIQTRLRTTFADSPAWEFIDEEAFDIERKSVGDEGATILSRVIATLDPADAKRRSLRMAGLDGEEELLFLYPDGYTDSLTNERFGRLRRTLADPGTVFETKRHNQGIRFLFRAGDETVLTVDIPCTINKNGAWISDPTPSEGAFHKKEGKVLKFGQRRPKKSREIATSINTYVNLRAAGVFGEVSESADDADGDAA